MVPAAATRSMAPPMPFTILPGIIQLARSPARDTWGGVVIPRDCDGDLPWELEVWCGTCMAPRMVRSTWPPRIIAKLSSLGDRCRILWWRHSCFGW